jgi:hypothetical protein
MSFLPKLHAVAEKVPSGKNVSGPFALRAGAQGRAQGLCNCRRRRPQRALREGSWAGLFFVPPAGGGFPSFSAGAACAFPGAGWACASGRDAVFPEDSFPRAVISAGETMRGFSGMFFASSIHDGSGMTPWWAEGNRILDGLTTAYASAAGCACERRGFPWCSSWGRRARACRFSGIFRQNAVSHGRGSAFSEGGGAGGMLHEAPRRGQSFRRHHGTCGQLGGAFRHGRRALTHGRRGREVSGESFGRRRHTAASRSSRVA